MNLLSLFYAYLAVKYLAQPFEKMRLFKDGIIDKDGVVIKGKQLDAFARLMFGIRQILSKVPMARTIVTVYALTKLFKESYNGTELATLLEGVDDNPIRHHPEYEAFLEDMSAGGEGIAGIGTDSPGIASEPLLKKKTKKKTRKTGLTIRPGRVIM